MKCRQFLGVLLLQFAGLSAPSAAVPPEVTRGLTWLSDQARTDGTLISEQLSAGAVVQARAESFRVLQQQTAGMPGAALDAVLAAPEDNTEFVARRTILAAVTQRSTAVLVTILARRQNADGGFAPGPGYASGVLDTAWALLALRAASYADSAVIQRALAYLARQADADGGFGAGDSRVFQSAYAVLALQAHAVQFGLSPALAPARNWLISAQTAGRYASVVDNAVAVMALSASSGDAASFAEAAAALREAQSQDGSWGSDPYATALAISALLAASGSVLPPTAGGAIGGTLIDPGSGAPLAGALIRASGPQTATTSSGPSGAFLLSGLAPGDYVLEITKAGYATVVASVRVVLGTTSSLGSVGMQASATTATLRGQVTDGGSGSPLSGVAIAVAGGPSTTTDGSGAFALTGLIPGSFTVTASKSGYGNAVGQGTLVAGGSVVFSPALYPTGEEPGETRVGGRVVDSSTQTPVAGATVQIGPLYATTDGSGNFSAAGLQPGATDVQIIAAGFRQGLYAATLVQGQNNLGDLALVPIPRTVVLTGAILEAATALPIGGASLVVVGTALRAVAGPGGTYRLEGIETPAFTLTVTASGYLRKTVNVSLSEFADGTLDVALDKAQSASGLSITRVATDRPVYEPFSSVEIEAEVSNVSATAAQLAFAATVFDALGNVVIELNDRRALGTVEIAPNGPTEVELETFLTNPPAGLYSVEVRGYDGAGALQVEGVASFTVGSTRRIAGGIALDPPLTQAGTGQAVAIGANLYNHGNLPVPAGSVQLTVTLEQADPSLTARTELVAQPLLAGAPLNGVSGVAYDGQGVAYALNRTDRKLLRILPDGQASVLFTLPSSLLSPAQSVDPLDLAIGPDGQFYVLNSSNEVFRIDSTGALQRLRTGLVSQRALTVDAGGTVFVTAVGNGYALYRLDAAGSPTLLLRNGLSTPSGAAVGRDGLLYVANSGDNSIARVTPAGEVLPFVTGLNRPAGMVVDAAGDFYVVNSGANSIVRVTPAGTVSPHASGLGNARHLALDSHGNLLVSNPGTRSVVKVAPGGTVLPFARGVVDGPQGMRYDAQGNLFVAGTGGVVKLDPADDLTVLTTAFADARGLAPAPGGDVYVARASGQIAKVAAGGGSTTFASGLSAPFGVALDGAGNLYVTEQNANRIARIDPAGNRSVFAQSLLTSPRQVAIDAGGRVHVLNQTSITRIDGDGAGSVVAQPFSSAGSFALLPDGGAYVKDSTAIKRVDASGVITTVKTGLPATAEGIVVDAAGNVYVAESASHQIKRLAPDGAYAAFATLPAQPGSLADDGAGGLLAVGPFGQIWQVSAAGVTSSVATVAGALRVAPGEPGVLYVLTAAGVSRLTLATKAVAPVLARTGLDAIRRSGDGRLLVLDTIANLLLTYDSSGVLASAIAGFQSPRDIVWTGTALLFNDPFRIFRLEPGQYPQIIGAGSANYLDWRQDTLYATNFGTVSVLDNGALQSIFTQSGFSGLTGVAARADGAFTVASASDSRLLTVGAGGAVLASYAGLSTPEGIAVDAQDNVFVANGSQLVRIESAGRRSAVVGTASGVDALAFDAAGVLHGVGANAAYRYDGNYTRTALGAVSSGSASLAELAFWQGRLHAVDSSSSVLRVLSAGQFSTLAAGLFDVERIAAGPDGAVYVAQGLPGLVTRVAGGVPTVYAGDLPGARSLAFDAGGKLYVGTVNALLFEVVPATGSRSLGDLPALLGAADFDALAVSPTGIPLISRPTENDLVKAVTLTQPAPPPPGTVLHTATAAMPELGLGPESAQLDLGGWLPPFAGDFRFTLRPLSGGTEGEVVNQLHVGPGASGRILPARNRLPPGDSVLPLTIALEGADFSTLAQVDVANIALAVSTGGYPLAMGTNASGEIFLTQGKELRVVPPGGGTPSVLWTSPYNIGMRGTIPVDDTQNLYVSGGPSGRDVLRVAPDGSAVTTVATLSEQIVSLVRDSRDRIVALTLNRVVRLEADGSQTLLTSAGVTDPYALTIDGLDTLYIQNRGNVINRVRADGSVAILLADPAITFEYEGMNIAGDCAGNVFVTPFLWAALGQNGEEYTLVQIVGSTGQAAAILDGRKINRDLTDMDFLVWDRFRSQLLIWTDLNSGRVYRVPVTCGAIDTDLHIVLPPGQSASGFDVAPGATLATADGGTEHVWSLKSLTALGRDLHFDTLLPGLRLAEERPVAREAFLLFKSTFAAADVKIPLAIPLVRVDAQLDLLAATDKPAYGPDQIVLGDLRLDNRDSRVRLGRLTAQISDERGALVERVVDQAVSLEPAGTLAVLGPFNTRANAPGRYTLTGVITDADTGLEAGRASASFLVVSGQAGAAAVGARIATDKAAYLPSETVRLRDRISSELRNAALDALTIVTRVLGPDGSLRFEKSEFLVQLAAGSVRDYEYSLPLAFAAPGEYRATLALRGAAGDELAAASTAFQVLSSAVTGSGLTGAVSAAPKAVPLGETATLALTATNQGNAAMAGVPLTLRIVDPATAQIVAQYAFAADLALGQSFQAAASWMAAGQPGTTYIVALLAQAGGNTLTLAQDLITVVTPPVSLAVAHGLRADARILVLASCGPGHAGQHEDSACAQQRVDFLRALLTELGYEHNVVASAEEFTRELRCGRYDVYWLTGGARKLSSTSAKELREAVFRGQGLLVDGGHDERNSLLDEALGVAYRGKLPGSAPDVVLGADWFSPARLPALGAALRFDLTHGTAQGTFAGATLPAVVSNAYGEGHAVLAAFDLTESIRAGAPPDAWRAALAAILEHLAPAAHTGFAEGSALPLRTLIENKGSAAQLEVRVALPAGASVIDAVPAAALGDAEARWQVDLAAGDTRALDLALRLPAGAATHALTASVAVLRNGQAVPYGDYPLVVETRSVEQLATAALDALALLQPAQQGERQKAAHARSQVQQAQAALAQGSPEAPIDDLIDALEHLRQIDSVSIAAARLAIDRLLEGAELRWCGSLCNPAAPASHNGDGFEPFAPFERLEVRGGRPGSGDWEWGLGTDTQKAGRFVQQHLEWVSDRAYRWELSYDGRGGGSYSVWDGGSLLFSREYAGGSGPLRAGNTLRFYVKSSAGPGKAKIQASVDAIQGKPVSMTLATAGNGASSEVTGYYYYPPMTAGFTAAGTVKLSFSGSAPPPESRLSFIVTSGTTSCWQCPAEATHTHGRGAGCTREHRCSATNRSGAHWQPH